MKYTIKRNNNTIATVRPEGQLQAGVMGEETVTMTFSLTSYVHFQTGDTVEVYGNTYYLATEPQVEKISSREFRYSLEFQGIKYELGKVQYLFPDAQNVLNLSEFHIMGNARTMLDLLVQNANRTGQGWTLGTIDETEAKQLNFSAENCLAVLSKIAQEFKLEYWVDGDKSIHLTERKAVSGYSFQYGKAKGLKSLTRQTLDGSNVVTRLYAFGSEKNIAGDYRGGQQKLRMPVPFLEKNTDIYGIIEGSQTFDVFPHRLGTVTAVNPANPLQFTDSGMDFDLNARENGNTKYLINGVPVKVTFNTGQLAGYTFEVKQYGYNTATKTFTLLKNQDEKAIEVPSDMLRPAIGDRYVLTDLIMPESYVTNAERELQQKAQAYLDENSRQRVVYSLVTDPIYFRNQNVNIQLGTTVRAIDKDFNLNDDLRVIRLTKDLQNPYNVQFEVAERAEIAYIVREYFEAEKSKVAMVQADKFNAEMARRAYRFGKEISENVFDGEGYFNAEKIKPLSIETKLLSVGSRMQQFSLPDVVISVENTTTVRNTQGKIVHLTLEENPREWQIPANTQTGITEGFNYVYIKAQRIGSNASVFVSPEKIAVDSDVAFYHFEAGYLGSVENGQRRIRMSHGFTQINPFEITTGRIAPPSGNHYIELTQDSINVVGNLHITDGNVNQIKQSISPDLLSLENRLKQYTDNVQVGGRNLVRNSQINQTSNWYGFGGRTAQLEAGETYTLSVNGRCNNVSEGKTLVSHIYRSDWSWARHIRIDTTTDTTGHTTFEAPATGSFIISHYYYDASNPREGSVTVNWVKLEKGNKPTDWSPAPEDLDEQFQTEQQSRQQAIDEAKSATEAYARAQAELARTLAIANADGKITEAEQRQINNATQKLQEAKNYANQKVNALRVGGRNLIRNIHNWNFRHGRILGAHEIAPNKTTKAVRLRLTPNEWDCYARVNVDSSGDYIFSGWVKLETATNFLIVINNTYNANAIYVKKEITGSGWQRFEVPFVLNGDRINLHVGGYAHYSITERQSAGNVLVWNLQLEKGNKATDWSPAPEDIDDEIHNARIELEDAMHDAQALLQEEINNVNSITQKLSAKADFLSETKIDGNTVATGAMLVGNVLGGNAGVNGSGLASTDVRFWAGSGFANRANAPFRVQDDGTMHATNAKISGTINAGSGSIGDFTLQNGRLTKSYGTGLASIGATLSDSVFELKDIRYENLTDFYTEYTTKMTSREITLTRKQKVTHSVTNTETLKITHEGIYRNGTKIL
ncbi:phage tail protein [Capnocytophaga canis]|uniref:phage tail protein n=1 Tax=Capnocytophaga canis TaxID=1848903 RepID=UPI00385A08E5